MIKGHIGKVPFEARLRGSGIDTEHDWIITVHDHRPYVKDIEGSNKMPIYIEATAKKSLLKFLDDIGAVYEIATAHHHFQSQQHKRFVSCFKKNSQ